jgi:aminoglycoside phosphotransferase (APT) family kinase protein
MTTATVQSAGREVTYLEAISQALDEEMTRDTRVFLMGEDIGPYGGAFRITEGFQEKYGARRLNAACARAIAFGDPSYRTIKTIQTGALSQYAPPRAGYAKLTWKDLVEGGHVIAGMDRIDIVAETSRGDVQLTLVRKRLPPWSDEVRALRLLQSVPLAHGRVPELICSGRDESGPWLLRPFYDGQQLQARVEDHKNLVPLEVIDTLARVHARFHERHDELEGLAVNDHDWWRQLLFGFTIPQVEATRSSSNRYADLTAVIEALVRWADDPAIAEALQILPFTLVHRDMHLGNVLEGSQGPTIIDWGNALNGPRFIDLENIITPDSAQAHAYRNTWVSLTGISPDPWLEDVGWFWATVQIRASYLHVGLSDVDGCLRMIDEGEEALLGLRAALTRG